MADAERVETLSAREKEVEERIKVIMMTIPNIIDPTVPIGKDDSENVEVERFGEPVVPDFEIPYHTDIMETFDGIDLDSARKVAGNGFYYLMRYRASAFRSSGLRKRFHDWQRLQILHSSLHDSFQRCNGCYELCGNGCNDV